MLTEIIVFLVLTTLIFFITRKLFEYFYLLFFSIFKSESLAYTILSMLFLPGTALHELSHFLMATILMLRVYDFTLLPQKRKNDIKLGAVVYEKKDLIRAVIVGIAPLFGGLFFFFFISYFSLFPTQSILLNLLMAYLIFTVSSTMFSSKQDLKDLIYMIPFILLFALLLYVLNLNPMNILNNAQLVKSLTLFFRRINLYLFFSLLINAALFFLLKLILKIKRKL